MHLNRIRRPVQLAFVILAAAAAVAAQPIRIVTLDATRWAPCQNNDRHFGGPYFTEARQALAAPANFGSGGTIDRPVQLTYVLEFDLAALANADVALLVGSSVPLSAAELMLLNSFALAGGGVVCFENRASTTLEHMVGGTDSPSGAGGAPVIVDSSSPIISGPFGTAGTNGGSFSRGFGGTFASIGPLGNSVVEIGGQAFVATFNLGAGRIVAAGDEEMISSLAVVGCAARGWDSRSRALFLNSVSWVVPAPAFQFTAADAVFSAYGTGCQNGAMSEGSLSIGGDPSTAVRFRLFGMPSPPSTGVLLLGVQRIDLPLLGCRLLVGQAIATLTLSSQAAINRRGGEAELELTVPATISGALDVQGWILDASAAGGLKATRGTEVRF